MVIFGCIVIWLIGRTKIGENGDTLQAGQSTCLGFLRLLSSRMGADPCKLLVCILPGPGRLEFLGEVKNLDRHKVREGLFVAISTFSASAQEMAALLSKWIFFIDGDLLALPMIRQNVGCRIEDDLRSRRLMGSFWNEDGLIIHNERKKSKSQRPI